MVDKLNNIQEKLPDYVKDLWSSAMDTISKSEQDVRKFVDQMIERGKITEEEGKKIVNELVEKLQEGRSKIESRASNGIDKTLHLINLPTKQDVEALSQKVTSLTRKVNKLKKEIAA